MTESEYHYYTEVRDSDVRIQTLRVINEVEFPAPSLYEVLVRGAASERDAQRALEECFDGVRGIQACHAGYIAQVWA